ncbi:MAG: 3-deoxy-8-phosphooctulonate synthase [Deltaproteobacteria bacterium]|nr:3-deoxy-8-phosphooctulonate synthase [Deltaproteobacteria bacterium]
MQTIKLKDFSIGGGKGLFFIIGPCVVESEKLVLSTLEALVKITEDLNAPFVFKSSYDKANRSSVKSFRGPGIKAGLKILKKAKETFKVPVLTDVHCKHDVLEVAEAVDILQIPAYLCRQTDLIVAVAKTGRVVNIKKGQFMAPGDMKNSIEKAVSTGNKNIFITERGTTFGYNNLVADMRAFPVLRGLGYPVVFDATHSVQTPSGLGTRSGGDRDMAQYLARAAVAAGVDGVFMEVHPDPDNALCDGPNSIALKDVKGLVKKLIEIDRVVRRG